MGVNKVIYKGRTLVDLTGDTVTADKLDKGVTAHNAAGNPITGTREAVIPDFTKITYTNVKNIYSQSSLKTYINDYAAQFPDYTRYSFVIVTDVADNLLVYGKWLFDGIKFDSYSELQIARGDNGEVIKRKKRSGTWGDWSYL